MKKYPIAIILILALAVGILFAKVFNTLPRQSSEVELPKNAAPRAAVSITSSQKTILPETAYGSVSVSFAQVARVIDGDTIEVVMASSTGVQIKETVRYIGMDAPETVDPRKPVQCFGEEASAKDKELVEGKTVRLEKDVSERDKYGRLLRYVWVGDTFINLELVKTGYARAWTYPPDVKYSAEFVAAEKQARESNLGLWSACK